MTKPLEVNESLRQPPERLVDPDQPAPTPPVVGTTRALPPTHCERCGGEIATERRHHREVDDYVMWFCSSSCASNDEDHDPGSR